jgi:uncharacterized protein
MKAKCLHEGQQKTYAVIFDDGDDPMEGLAEFARRQQLTGSQFTAIGAFSEVTLGYFNWETKDYEEIPINEQVEVLSFIGDIALHDGQPQVHAHVVLGKRDGTAHGGHLLKARVRPTLEVILTESPAHLQKKHDAQVGLALIDIP